MTLTLRNNCSVVYTTSDCTDLLEPDNVAKGTAEVTRIHRKNCRLTRHAVNSLEKHKAGVTDMRTNTQRAAQCSSAEDGGGLSCG